MKKIAILLSVLVMATSCDWFEFDNQDGYNAQVEGNIIDSETGERVQMAWPNNARVEIIEKGWNDENPESDKWYVKPNGTYRNLLVFAGDYIMETKDRNFYPATQEFKLKKGANKVDFKVTPYVRIYDPTFSYEDGKIVARCKVKASDPDKTPDVTVQFFMFTDRWVSDGNNTVSGQKTAKLSKTKKADGETVLEMTVDPTITSGMQFVYERDHYIRIGAVATGSGVNSSKRYNYSPVYKMSSDFMTVEEVTNWDEELD